MTCNHTEDCRLAQAKHNICPLCIKAERDAAYEVLAGVLSSLDQAATELRSGYFARAADTVGELLAKRTK